jgi:deoxyribonuclease V
MQIHSHPWNLSPQEAHLLQKKLAGYVVRKNRLEPVKTVAGIDVGLRDDAVKAAVVILNFPGLDIAEKAIAARKVEFPYIPGLLSFREGPVILDALEKVATKPDLIIFDGQGVAHPRRLGIASHIGLLANIPTIGCAKSRLCGKHEEPGFERGNLVPLVDQGETIGAVVRTRSRIKPMYVSVGHRIYLKTSIKYVLACCRGYRLPETTRQAHHLAAALPDIS